MTKAEAAVVRAALRYWRTQMKLSSGQEINVRTKHEAMEGLLQATEAASKEVKDWVFVKAVTNPNEPLMQCDGCKAEEKVKCPLPMSEFADILNGFRMRHVDCGPVGEDVERKA